MERPLRSCPEARRSRHNWSAIGWGVTHSLGLLALSIVGVLLVLSLASGRLPLARTLVSLFPASVRNWFEQPVHFDKPAVPEPAKQVLQSTAPGDSAGSRRQMFTIGSSEEAVMRAQGRPGRVEGGTWFYGESEIRFVAGRVVAWKNSSTTPLSVQ